jgi:MinD-like ATPase involved in chromosome partitioning or flagellar assembly
MSKIISIHSYRGGTGKSNLTANLAATVVQLGKRAAIVDTDIQSPGVHILFGMGEENIKLTLNDYLYGRCSIHKAAYDVTHVLGNSGDGALYLLPSSIKPADITRVLREGYDVSMLNEGYHDLIDALDLDYLFIDTHPGLNEETLLSIAISDAVILILRPDQQDFQGTAVTVEVARKLEQDNLLLVINKALPSLDLADLRRQVAQTYRAPVATVLPLSEDMVRLGSAGLFSLKNLNHPYSQGVREVASHILSLA